MGATVPTKIDFNSGMVLDMLGVPARVGEPAFDSYLLEHKDGHNNHTLTLALRIYLDPILPPWMHAPPGFRFVYPEWGGTLRVIKPWEQADWNHFVSLYKQEALLWNDRFWLIPPAGFSALDVKVAGRTIRPNIYCHLYIDLVGSVAKSHRSIIVISLDTAANPFFRSDASHYSSDAVQSYDLVTNNQGSPYLTTLPPGRPPAGTNPVKDKLGHPMKYYTIAHELGHALGLDHIGQIHNDPLCTMAILLSQTAGTKTQQSYLPAIVQGGIGASVCYGVGAPPDRSRNVMGMGSEFDENNATPWQQRIALHTATKPAAWKISLTKVPPKPVS